jgi:hypothetical protein
MSTHVRTLVSTEKYTTWLVAASSVCMRSCSAGAAVPYWYATAVLAAVSDLSPCDTADYSVRGSQLIS